MTRTIPTTRSRVRIAGTGPSGTMLLGISLCASTRSTGWDCGAGTDEDEAEVGEDGIRSFIAVPVARGAGIDSAGGAEAWARHASVAGAPIDLRVGR